MWSGLAYGITRYGTGMRYGFVHTSCDMGDLLMHGGTLHSGGPVHTLKTLSHEEVLFTGAGPFTRGRPVPDHTCESCSNVEDPFIRTGRGSSIGSEFAWHASGPEFDPHVQHILSWRLGHENISTPILPLPLIQEEQLSVTGEKMCTKYW